jgi:hypothetical protein|tara:strand:- start:2119 stop:3660 length:1542 start_codon:yes stop_codon:yes gene_type:complete
MLSTCGIFNEELYFDLLVKALTFSKRFMIYFLIPGIFLSGLVLTSFSESTSTEPQEIIIEIEPPKENFENNSKEQEKQEPESENSNGGGNGNTYTSYVTGSGYARGGDAILINTPEGIRLNEKLIGQQELEELETLHGEAFWQRIDQLTYDHYGLADALLNPNTDNSYFTKGTQSSENINSNLDYYILERGYDPTNLSKVPNNIFTPLKYDLARAVMQKLQDSNANDLDISKFKNSNLEILSPNAFSMTKEDQNMMYHNDVESRAMSMLKDTLPTISSSSESSESMNSQNNGDVMNQENNLTSMPDFGTSSSQEQQPQKIPTPTLDQELFQNTEHIKEIISQNDLTPNYDTKIENTLPIIEILLSVILSSIAGIIGFIILKKFVHKTKNTIGPLTVYPVFDYKHETQKLLETANFLYNSKQIKDAYEQFSHAIRFYYSHHYDIKREVTTFEILQQIEINEKSDYKTIYNCLALCGIVEFAKHDERKDDFSDCLSSFYKIINLKNKIKKVGDSL